MVLFPNQPLLGMYSDGIWMIVGGLRGLGVAIRPMIISLVGSCLLRIVWIATVFQVSKNLPTLFISYPISWFVTTLAQITCLVYVYKKVRKDSV